MNIKTTDEAIYAFRTIAKEEVMQRQLNLIYLRNSYELPAPWIEWLEEYGTNGRKIN